MVKRPEISRIHWDNVKVTHLVLPPYEATEFTNVADPGSIAMGYFGQKGATLQAPGGRTLSIDIEPGDVGLTGAEPVRWLKLKQPAEVVEVAASPTLRMEVAAELGMERFLHLDNLHGWSDPYLWALISRFRSAARNKIELTDVQGDELVRRIYARVFHVRFGARQLNWRGELDQSRFRRVSDFVDAHLGDSLTLAALARSAALSPFHFAHGFKRTTGWPPHVYVTIRRIERARHLLLKTPHSVEHIASLVGFSNLSHFRRMFRAHIGALPSELRGGRLASGRSRTRTAG
jgi:AraC family transcriptional regulator